MQTGKRKSKCYVLKVHVLAYQYAYLQRLQAIRTEDTGSQCTSGELIRESLHLLRVFYKAYATEARPLRLPGFLMAGNADKMEDLTVCIRKEQHEWLKKAANSARFVADEYITNASLVRLGIELLREKYPC